MNQQTEPTEVLRAFHDSAELKDHYLARVRSHAAADRLIQGRGWVNGRGAYAGARRTSYARQSVALLGLLAGAW